MLNDVALFVSIPTTMHQSAYHFEEVKMLRMLTETCTTPYTAPSCVRRVDVLKVVRVNVENEFLACRLGLLAVLFGDGVLQVLAVPLVKDIDALAVARKLLPEKVSKSRLEAMSMLLRLSPKASAQPVSKSCLGSCVEWLPSPPHDLLLVSFELALV